MQFFQKALKADFEARKSKVGFVREAAIDRQLWEIDENLIRSELTPTQQGEHMVKREELWGLRNVAGASCTSKRPQHEKGFAAETAEATGVNKSTVTRALSRAKGVTEEASYPLRFWDQVVTLPHPRAGSE